MAQQKRMIYDSVYANSELNMLPIEIRHLYIGTIVLSDDDGKMNADPRYIKGRIFGFDDAITSPDVQKMLEKLHEVKQIILYKVKDRQYLKHPKWLVFQHIRSDMYRNSTVPEPLHSRNANGTQVSKINKISNGDVSFDSFWDKYPHKVGKKEALRAWVKISPSEVLNLKICAALEKQKESDQWKRDGGKFIPHPSTWLNGERWNDELGEKNNKFGI